MSFANYVNPNYINYENDKFDTVIIHYKQLDKLLLAKSYSKPKYKEIKLHDYDIIFMKDTADFTIESIWGYTFLANESDNELIPRLSNSGLKYCFEFKGDFFGHSFEKYEYKPNFIQKHVRYDPLTKTYFFYIKVKN